MFSLHRFLADPLLSVTKTWRRLRKRLGKGAEHDGRALRPSQLRPMSSSPSSTSAPSSPAGARPAPFAGQRY